MSWFKNKLRNWLMSDGSAKPSQNRLELVSSEDSEHMSDEPTMRFKIFNARGGKIVEFSRYDRIKDRNLHDLYIIRNDENFGERIAKIAMLEGMKD